MIYKVNLDLIKETRQDKGYSLNDMAIKLGFNNKSKYYRRETGEYKFQPEELPALAKILGIPIEKIFSSEYRKSKQKEVV
ncbi:helix-turn-helix transcriptional regulator [Vagococcus fluvialis]|jgi:transcriptional regulator with XRE-family HTH domain|uniref:helix-turn-helix transcriptional regulator n=1 Tax=Vagococcus fluvialis TaxID=2738 RepID=UPI001A900B75|nr:helix-turn-helix transcriptional regulator [Vagococcus fluvialis]MBO0430468.1 helix-turn-helix transcriptional regulator [Vagococcus fluvialis]